MTSTMIGMRKKRFLKIAEAAEKIGVSQAMVYSWVSDGAIKTVDSPPISGKRPQKRISTEEVARIRRLRALGLPLRFQEELQVLQG